MWVKSIDVLNVSNFFFFFSDLSLYMFLKYSYFSKSVHYQPEADLRGTRGARALPSFCNTCFLQSRWRIADYVIWNWTDH